MKLLTNILLGIFGAGFVGNLSLYYLKRKHSKQDADKELMSPIIDEICKLCSLVDILIVHYENSSKKLEDIRKKEVSSFSEANELMNDYIRLQDELENIYKRELHTELDLIDIDIHRKKISEIIEKRNVLMDTALSCPDEEKKMIIETKVYICNKLEDVYGYQNRLYNSFKFNNKKTSKHVQLILSSIDKKIKGIIQDCRRYPSLRMAPVLLNHFYKELIDYRLTLSL